MNSKDYGILLKSFKNSVSFVDHQLKSFNEFVDIKIQRIIDEIGEIQLETPELAEFKIKLGKIRMQRPCVKEADGAVRNITPIESRIRDLTYASPIYVDMMPIINGVEQEPHEVKLGEIPIMVKSKLCMLSGMSSEELMENGEDSTDPGGYFIINGTERVIVMVEEVLPNRPIIERKGDEETARINSEASGFVQRHLIERKSGIITISYANMKKVPIVVVLRALGMETDKEIIESISDDKRHMQELYFNLYEYDVKTSEEAREYIGSKKMKIPQKEYREKRIDDVLDKYLLPHLGQEKKNRKEKALYLSKIAKKLIKLGTDKIEEQDIDHYANKRLKLVGNFLEVLLRSILLGKYGLVSRIVYSYQKLVKRGKMPSIKSIVESDYLSKRIISHMATGQWVGGRTGVCQRLERTNFIRTVAHLRNVISPLSASQEHFKARALHGTQWGRLCAEETPEGVNIGLRKYLALFAVISDTAHEKDIKAIMDVVKKESEEGRYTIYVNGRVIGTTSHPENILSIIKTKRRTGVISPYISVAFNSDFHEVNINTDSGRLARPVIVVENGLSKLKMEHIKRLEAREINWNDLLREGAIEYIDAEEEDNCLVAVNENSISKSTTHLEIDPSIILGISASMVPFPAHNRGDRVNFGAKMFGQSLGLYASNYLIRTDTKADILVYSQMPLVNTTVGKELDIDNHPQGQNIIIAVMSYKGYNMEDGIVFNKASVERGFGRSFFFRSYTTEEKKYWGIEKDEIKIPDKSVNGYRTEESYANLSSDGIINREISVNSDDVIIGKISPLRFFGPVESFMTETENRRETSEVIRSGEEGIVDNVLMSETISGNKLVKINVRTDRVPELGDKFASRHGQKGVISLIVPEEDMPFTSSGIVPDILLNPHAIPSRMTIGQLLEIIASKVSALSGVSENGSAFVEITEGSIRAALSGLGFRDDGKEALFDGVTGKMYEARILIGNCYYQKLHHMVANKLQSRAKGPVTLLTKQPTAGRSKQGGLRLGEMEKDCLIAHGAALLLKERFSSDKYSIPVCLKCGLVAIEDRVKGKKYCCVCKKSKIECVDISYAFKLMLDELKCLGVYPRINLDIAE